MQIYFVGVESTEAIQSKKGQERARQSKAEQGSGREGVRETERRETETLMMGNDYIVGMIWG